MKKITLLIGLILSMGYGIFAQNLSKPEQNIQSQVIYGDGRHDDTQALNAWGNGKTVMYKGKILGNTLQNGTFLITWRTDLRRKNSVVRNNTFVWKYTGYDRTDWVNYGRKTKHYRNKIVDIGTGDNPYEKEHEQWLKFTKLLRQYPMFFLAISPKHLTN